MTIAKPPGSVGSKGYQLQHHMGLGDDKDTYKKILVTALVNQKANETDSHNSEPFVTSAMRAVSTLTFHIPISRWYDWGSCSPL